MKDYATPYAFGPLIKFIGRNPDFVAYWSATKQRYSVWKLGKHIANVFSFREAENYLN